MIATCSDVELAPPPSRAYRSPGLHQSSIIRAIAYEVGILDKDWLDDLDLVDASTERWWETLDDVARLRISLGLAWEEWYIPQIPEVVDHPGEMTVEGVHMTHDGESLDVILSQERHPALGFIPRQRYEIALHEVKLTYKSTKTVGNLLNQWMWLAQMMGYCRALKTRLAHLHVLYVCGDYTWPMRPKLQRWDIEFTGEEIETNWELLMDYRAERMRL